MKPRTITLALTSLLVACAGPRTDAPPPTAPAPIAMMVAAPVVEPTPEPTPVAPMAKPAMSDDDVAKLRAELRKALGVARKRQIERLRAYREAGKFPLRDKNPFGDSISHRLVSAPLFVDHAGTPCAVGFLMQKSGWTAEVATIAKETPGIHIEEVTSGPIVDWVLRSGLTQDEATLIQPDYSRFVAKVAKELARDRKRLRDHFLAVEKQLVANTEVSLDIATFRLLPAMVAGGSLDELNDR